jgi:hypothetical protein
MVSSDSELEYILVLVFDTKGGGYELVYGKDVKVLGLNVTAGNIEWLLGQEAKYEITGKIVETSEAITGRNFTIYKKTIIASSIKYIGGAEKGPTLTITTKEGAPLCEKMNCAKDKSLLIIPAGTKLEYTNSRPIDLVNSHFVVWYKVSFNGKTGWVDWNDTDQIKPGYKRPKKINGVYKEEAGLEKTEETGPEKTEPEINLF